MPGFTTYTQQKVLDHVRGKTAFAMPTVYIGAYTVAPTDAGGGTECNYTGYARLATTGADWTAASGINGPNATVLKLPACTGGTNNIVAVGLFDALTGGNLLDWGTASLAVSNGITPQFDAGAINVTLD